MSRTNQHYFLIRTADVADVDAFHADDRFDATTEDDDWLYARLDDPGERDEIADDHLQGWGDAFYIRDPRGGGGSFVAYRHTGYGAAQLASNGNRGGYHHVRNYIVGHAKINTTPPESIPKDELGE